MKKRDAVHVCAAAMQIQAAWRGLRGRAEASEAFVQLQQAVTERLQQEAAALEIQRRWHTWRQRGDAAGSAPPTATERSAGGTRTDSAVRTHGTMNHMEGSRSPHAASGRAEDPLHCSDDGAGGSAAPGQDLSAADRPGSGDWSYENRKNSVRGTSFTTYGPQPSLRTNRCRVVGELSAQQQRRPAAAQGGAAAA